VRKDGRALTGEAGVALLEDLGLLIGVGPGVGVWLEEEDGAGGAGPALPEGAPALCDP
jgi:hypothetical protein